VIGKLKRFGFWILFLWIISRHVCCTLHSGSVTGKQDIYVRFQSVFLSGEIQWTRL